MNICDNILTRMSSIDACKEIHVLLPHGFDPVDVEVTLDLRSGFIYEECELNLSSDVSGCQMMPTMR